MKTRIELLHSYVDAFRHLVNDRVWGRNEHPHKSLKLNSEADWSFVCVAMDVVGDASLAISNFLRFGLNGPSRYEDVGERYLRLYGLLSAAYVQQQAALKLYSLMNCRNPKSVRATFAALEITELRHKLASHSLDFMARGSNSKQAFVPVRIDLAGFACTITENRGNDSRTVKLDQALDVHCRTVIDVLDRTYEKSVGTLYKGQQKRIKEFKTALADLRFARDGNLLIRIGEGAEKHEVRIVLVQPQGG